MYPAMSFCDCTRTFPPLLLCVRGCELVTDAAKSRRGGEEKKVYYYTTTNYCYTIEH